MRLPCGIPELLTALHRNGVKVAVNSNKVNEAVQALCRAHFSGLCDMAQGEVPDLPKKPAPDGARRIMAQFHVAPERALYVGDSDTDLMTAKTQVLTPRGCPGVSGRARR